MISGLDIGSSCSKLHRTKIRGQPECVFVGLLPPVDLDTPHRLAMGILGSTIELAEAGFHQQQ
jgi:hypothetical protein